MLEDTVKTRAAYVPTESQLAHNELALAIKSYTQSGSKRDRRRVEAAQKWIRKIEEASRQASFALLEKVCEKQPGYKKRSLWVRVLLLFNLQF